MIKKILVIYYISFIKLSNVQLANELITGLSNKRKLRSSHDNKTNLDEIKNDESLVLINPTISLNENIQYDDFYEKIKHDSFVSKNQSFEISQIFDVVENELNRKILQNDNRFIKKFENKCENTEKQSSNYAIPCESSSTKKNEHDKNKQNDYDIFKNNKIEITEENIKKEISEEDSRCNKSLDIENNQIKQKNCNLDIKEEKVENLDLFNKFINEEDEKHNKKNIKRENHKVWNKFNNINNIESGQNIIKEEKNANISYSDDLKFEENLTIKQENLDKYFLINNSIEIVENDIKEETNKDSFISNQQEKQQSELEILKMNYNEILDKNDKFQENNIKTRIENQILEILDTFNTSGAYLSDLTSAIEIIILDISKWDNTKIYIEKSKIIKPYENKKNKVNIHNHDMIQKIKQTEVNMQELDDDKINTFNLYYCKRKYESQYKFEEEIPTIIKKNKIENIQINFPSYIDFMSENSCDLDYMELNNTQKSIMAMKNILLFFYEIQSDGNLRIKKIFLILILLMPEYFIVLEKLKEYLKNIFQMEFQNSINFKPMMFIEKDIFSKYKIILTRLKNKTKYFKNHYENQIKTDINFFLNALGKTCKSEIYFFKNFIASIACELYDPYILKCYRSQFEVLSNPIYNRNNKYGLSFLCLSYMFFLIDTKRLQELQIFEETNIKAEIWKKLQDENSKKNTKSNHSKFGNVELIHALKNLLDDLKYKDLFFNEHLIMFNNNLFKALGKTDSKLQNFNNINYIFRYNEQGLIICYEELKNFELDFFDIDKYLRVANKKYGRVRQLINKNSINIIEPCKSENMKYFLCFSTFFFYKNILNVFYETLICEIHSRNASNNN